jgi:hypothetical protein
MGRGSRAIALACLVVFGTASTACQPLYGGKPEKLKNPDRKKPPPTPPDEVLAIKYVEDCQANFRDDPKNVRRDTTMSNSLVQGGDDAVQQADKAKEPSAQAELIRVAIDKYINALKKDPYNADATLRLALAYDRVLRKGCALKLLARLPLLEANEKYKKQAKAAADQVGDSKEWFRGYRKEAVAAVGR